MTGPIPGQGDIPQPWGGQPRDPTYGYPGQDYQPQGQGQTQGQGHGQAHGYDDVQWSDQVDPGFPSAGYGGPFGGPPRPGRGRGRVAVIAAVAVLVLAGAGTAVWYFTAGPGKSVDPRPVAVTSDPPLPTREPVRSSSTAPSDGAAAYDVGSCFDEQSGSAPGKVQLNPVPCGGSEAVFVINRIVPNANDCDVGPDYHRHGYEVPDETADVAYCASLVVPANSCFVLGGNAPIARAACGSDPNAVQVLAIETAPSVDSACLDKTDPDVWFYQSATSGQFACVSRPQASTGTSGSSTAPTTSPATSTSNPAG